MKKSKWMMILCSATLTLQLASMPLTTLAIVPNEQLINTNESKSPVMPPDNTGNTTQNNSTEVLPDDIQTVNSTNPLLSEAAKKDGDYHTYSWSSNVVIPTDFKEHLSQVELALKNVNNTDLNNAAVDQQKVLETAYLLAMLPIQYTEMEDMRVKANLLESFYESIDTIENPEFKGKVYEVLANIFLDWVKLTDGSQEFINLSNALEKMPDSAAKDIIQAEVDKIIDKNKPTDEELNNGIPNENKPGNGNPDDAEVDDGKVIDNDYIGGVKPPSKPPVPTLPEADFDTTRTVFNEKSCENTIYYYKGNKLIRTETKKVDKRSCLSQSGKSNYVDAKSVRYTGYNPYDKSQRLALLKSKQKEDELKEDLLPSDLTIQYTFNKNDESPYYFDTGINVNAKKEVDYDQAKSALQIISIQAKGQSVEDVAQVLALVDGQIIRIKSYEELKAFDEFKDNFKLTKVGVKLQDTRSSTKQDLIDLIEFKETHSIIYKDHETTLTERPIIDNNIVLFGAEQLAEMLDVGVQVKEDGKVIELAVKGSTMEYTIDSSKALLDGQEIDLNVPVRFNKDMKVMIPINSILNQLGLEIIVDGETIEFLPIKE